jgi:hypothetical protein
MADPSGYPQFPDGDVIIQTTTGETWKLHSWVLRTASGFFKSQFEQHEPIALKKKDLDEGKTVKWRFSMGPNMNDARFAMIKWIVSFISLLRACQTLSIQISLRVPILSARLFQASQC